MAWLDSLKALYPLKRGAGEVGTRITGGSTSAASALRFADSSKVAEQEARPLTLSTVLTW